MFPSSTLDETAAASAESFLCLRKVELLVAEAVPAEPVSLALMIELMDTFEPDLGGIDKMLGQKSNSLLQAEESALFFTMLDRISASAEQQAGLADLGICLMIGHLATG